MLLNLVMTNFMQHTNRTVIFTEGVNCIRGANEAGKSTIYLAVLYALYGVRALPLSLDETVTWGQSPSSLRVNLTFTHNGAEYEIYRAKSGAELNGNGIKVTGQTEVSNFVGKLLGADMATALRVLVANQDDIRAALTSGSSKLIEDLSGIDLIETLVGKMQASRSCGNTRTLEEQVRDLTEALGARPEPTTEAEQEALLKAENAEAAARAALTEAQVVVDAERPGYDAARLSLANVENLKRQHDHLKRVLKDLKHEIDNSAEVVVPDYAAIQADFDADQEQRTRQQVYNRFLSLKQFPVEGTEQEFRDTHKSLPDRIEALETQIANMRSGIAHAEGHLSLEGNCPTCGSVLQDPENLARIKGTAQEFLNTTRPQLTTAMADLTKLRANLQALNKLIGASEELNIRMQEFGDNVSVSNPGLWPTIWQWVGSTDFQVSTRDFKAELAFARKEEARAATVEANYQANTAAYAKYNLELAALGPVLDAVQYQSTVSSYEVLLRGVKTLQNALEQAQATTASARSRLELAAHSVRSILEQWDEKLRHKQKLEATIGEMVLHNGIIKKLRESRPVVANQLWALVLHIVSDYFSQIRGTNSVVTKDADGFKIDGRPVQAFSGSTVDALGLAVRFSLQKIFLPLVDTVMIDEGGRGMDENRHSNLVGQIARLDLPQAVLITHSSVADSFSANLIEI